MLNVYFLSMANVVPPNADEKRRTRLRQSMASAHSSSHTKNSSNQLDYRIATSQSKSFDTIEKPWLLSTAPLCVFIPIHTRTALNQPYRNDEVLPGQCIATNGIHHETACLSANLIHILLNDRQRRSEHRSPVEIIHGNQRDIATDMEAVLLQGTERPHCHHRVQSEYRIATG